MKKLLAMIVLGLLACCASLEEPEAMKNNPIKSSDKVEIFNLT